MTDRNPPCINQEQWAAFVNAIADFAEAMLGWIRSNPGAVLSWREVLTRSPVGLDEPGAVELIAASPDAERMLRDVGAATGANPTLGMVRIALGLVGQMSTRDLEVN